MILVNAIGRRNSENSMISALWMGWDETYETMRGSRRRIEGPEVPKSTYQVAQATEVKWGCDNNR
jgi:hypothetical protein